MKTIELKEKLPQNIQRTNGFALGKSYKGNFVIDNKKPAILYISNSNDPVIYLESKDQELYFNLKTKTKTLQLFEKLEKKVME